MACAVYCLAPSPEDTDRMVGRAREAGIPAAKIRVVTRGQGARAPSATQRTAVRWWSAPLPAALWWVALYSYSWPAVVAVPPSIPRPAPEVITLDAYRAGRGAGR